MRVRFANVMCIAFKWIHIVELGGVSAVWKGICGCGIMVLVFLLTRCVVC